jgi:ATP-dependent Clp protease ATP-binding subunit ClpB
MAKLTKKERIAQIEKQLASLKEEYQTKKAKWEDQKAQGEKIKNLQKEIKDLEHQAQIAEKQTDYNKAAEIRYNTLPEKQKELAELEGKEAENEIHNDVVEAVYELLPDDGNLLHLATDENGAYAIIPTTMVREL